MATIDDNGAKSDENANIDRVVDVVSAFVANNKVSPSDLISLIHDVNKAFEGLGKVAIDPEPAKLNPAVPIRKSVTDDYIVCLEDGLKFKSLKRHLRTKYGMTPEGYRKKWGLPADYPMVCPSYSAARSALAKNSGLGQLRKGKAPKKVVAKKAPGRAKKA